MTQIANRTKELKLFKQMLNGEVSQRILLIEAPTGFGKTGLLLQFERLCPAEMTSAWVDLKAAQTGIPYVLSRIRKKLGANRCPHFSRAVQDFLTGGVQVSDNVVSGQENWIQVVQNVDDENRRNFLLTNLQNAFFRDLTELGQPILLILDTFNEAPESLARWVEGSFLAEAAETPNLFVVVAGQQVPQATGEWSNCHHCRRLEKISDPEAWYIYAKNQGLPFNKDVVSTVTTLSQGLPAEVRKMFETLATGQS